MIENAESVEVNDVEDAGFGYVVGTPVEEVEASAQGLGSSTEEAPEDEGEAPVDAGVRDPEEGASDVGDTELQDPPVDIEPGYDPGNIPTEVYFNDGTYVICDTQTLVYWFEQKVVGIHPETGEMIDLGYKAERFEDYYPATEHDMLAAVCDTPGVEATPAQEELVEWEQEDLPVAEVSTPVQGTPEVLAVTGSDGGAGFAVAGALVIAAAVLLFIEKKWGRKK